jgi:hypothetical protein
MYANGAMRGIGRCSSKASAMAAAPEISEVGAKGDGKRASCLSAAAMCPERGSVCRAQHSSFCVAVEPTSTATYHDFGLTADGRAATQNVPWSCYGSAMPRFSTQDNAVAGSYVGR